ncbi:uncharacterized protein LOC105426864 [Pogonomyrmex barbatus]|uniref:Uncharacterized protein LOC105426864 n=1 Tax=Pogonomyrmex barbatus TaxID=144034 RepID=A0A6I9W833_9HYME|nr:uncharacterized protein LOC105426864 [Pogonomyrmex barbatus]XP_011636566.1 uncharacterized protein LOC105426864 [Pogonomyrmex barbatus]
MSNYDIFAMDELAIGDINEHLHIDVEKINSNLMIQQPLDEENANSFYQADTHLQNAKSGSQWLYNEADQQPVMMISPEQTSQVNDILNNDAFTFDTNKRLKSDVEIDGNIMNQLIQQLLDDNNLSTFL